MHQSETPAVGRRDEGENGRILHSVVTHSAGALAPFDWCVYLRNLNKAALVDSEWTTFLGSNLVNLNTDIMLPALPQWLTAVVQWGECLPSIHEVKCGLCPSTV